MTSGGQGLPKAPLPSVIPLLVSNLLPLWAVWAGHMSVGDVFVVYWLENVAYWAVTIVKVRTAQAPVTTTWEMTENGRSVEPTPRNMSSFFAMHYGIFTLVHGVFALVLANVAVGELHVSMWVLAGLGFLLSHLGSLWIDWFDAGERFRVAPNRAMMEPYPRMLVLHVAILVAFPFVLRDDATSAAVGDRASLFPVLLLCGVKTIVDIALHLWERRRHA